MTCEDKKITQMEQTDILFPLDIMPLVQQGKNKIISIENLVQELQKLIHCNLDCADYDIHCALAKAEDALNKSIETLKIVNNAWDAATKAYVLAVDDKEGLKNLSTEVLNIENNIKVILTNIGLNADSTYTPDPNTHYITNVVSLKTADSQLDNTIYLEAVKIVKLQNDVTNIINEIVNLKNLADTKADKATTLAGYGITDAYTKTEIDNKFSGIYTILDNINGVAENK